MNGISRFREVEERNNRREQLASKEEIICQIMSLALPGIRSFVLEGQNEKGRSPGSAVFVREALCWDYRSTQGSCLSWQGDVIWELVVCHWTDFISAFRGSVPALALFRFRDRKCRKGNISGFWKLSSLFRVAHSLEAKVFVALPVWLIRRKDKNMPEKILKEHQQAMILQADKKTFQFFLSISYSTLLFSPTLLFLSSELSLWDREKNNIEKFSVCRESHRVPLNFREALVEFLFWE